MNYFISHIILSIFSKYFLPFFISVIGGTGLVSLIDTKEARKQHQKDITITKIRKFRKRILKYNQIFYYQIDSKKAQLAKETLIRTTFFISSWSVRINKKMLEFSSRIILKYEYDLLEPIIKKCLKEYKDNKQANYYQMARRTSKFFKTCGIIHKWK